MPCCWLMRRIKSSTISISWLWHMVIEQDSPLRAKQCYYGDMLFYSQRTAFTFSWQCSEPRGFILHCPRRWRGRSDWSCCDSQGIDGREHMGAISAARFRKVPSYIGTPVARVLSRAQDFCRGMSEHDRAWPDALPVQLLFCHESVSNSLWLPYNHNNYRACTCRYLICIVIHLICQIIM